jgi:hypothetical protein
MTIPYRIVKIENTQFAFFPDKFIVSDRVKVDVAFNFAPSKDLSMIRCTSIIHYTQNDNLLLVLELATYFEIAQVGIDNIKKDGKVPVDFLRYMGTIAIGTARGVIHAKTEGSVMNPVVLPPINLVEIIREDLKVEGE